MKISKEKLLRIIKEECDRAMIAPAPAGNGIAMDYLDQEGEMAKRQLSQIAEYAAELDQMLMDDTQLEAWVQAKLTKAADYIKTVKHYVEYGMEEGAYDQVNGEMVPQKGPMAINTPEMIEVGPDFEEKY
jgi:hypothetical protein